MKYGTWTTIDAPTKKQGEAFVWLKKQFDKIDGKVRILNNPHDFGPYQSFEVDYPVDMENVEDDDGSKDYIKEEWLVKEEWIEKANNIETDYNKKFNKYL